MSGIVIIGDGYYTSAAIGRADEFPTVEAFMKAVRRELLEDVEASEEPLRGWFRWVPDTSGAFDMVLLNARPHTRGAWEAWYLDLL